MTENLSKYKLVPVEPTPEMVAEGARHLQIMSIPEREAASVYQAMLAAAPDVQGEHYPDDEWIPTNGKKPDLPDGTLVDVKFLDGDTVSGRRVDLWMWVQHGEYYDITHYRIHQPETAV